jgi:carbonic anhydrase
MKDIRERSPIMKELEDAGTLKIVGGVYDMDTGRVNFIE